MGDQLKLPEVARRLGVSEKTARRYVKSGTLPSVFVGNAYRVSEEDLEKFLQEAKVAPGGGLGKEPSRSSPEPSLFNGLESERQVGAAKNFTDNLNHFAQKWREEAKDPQNQGVYWCSGVQATAIGLTDLFDKLGLRELILRKITEVGEQSPSGLLEEIEKGKSGRALSDPEFVVAMDLLKAFEDMHDAADQALEADETVDWMTIREAEQRRKAFSVIQGDLTA